MASDLPIDGVLEIWQLVLICVGGVLLLRILHVCYLRSLRAQYIASLDPVRDKDEMAKVLSGLEFPFDYTRALEFALFRTFAVPSVGGLLFLTKEFELRCQKRYDDTDLILNQILENGLSSERGTGAIERMNLIHGQYKISNDDYKYVLTSFMFQPGRWCQSKGWRRMTPHEELGWFHFWLDLGRKMHISDLSDDIEVMRAFNRNVENTRFECTPQNKAVMYHTVNLFCSWLPSCMLCLARPAVFSLMDSTLQRCFGTPRHRILYFFIWLSLCLRSLFVRLFLAPRIDPVRKTSATKNQKFRFLIGLWGYYPTYPTGCPAIDAVGAYHGDAERPHSHSMSAYHANGHVQPEASAVSNSHPSPSPQPPVDDEKVSSVALLERAPSGTVLNSENLVN